MDDKGMQGAAPTPVISATSNKKRDLSHKDHHWVFVSLKLFYFI